jgi:hypothetical protein
MEDLVFLCRTSKIHFMDIVGAFYYRWVLLVNNAMLQNMHLQLINMLTCDLMQHKAADAYANSHRSFFQSI